MAIESSTNMTPAEFAKTLGDSGLLAPDEISGTLEMSGSAPTATGGDLAQRFISAGKLTPFQAKAILDGRLDEVLIGNYEVLTRLGAGAMGTVYQARHRRMKRIVAIKVLSRALVSPAFVQRFQREVETLARLAHPNIIMAFDADEADIGHFLVMEFVEGRDLATLVEQNGRLPLADAVEATLQAARGLEYAHAKNVVHRDIKPANIMWDVSGVVKVADLGLARLGATPDSTAATALTQAGGIVGTVDYMAPEQAVDSTAIDHRVDIYGLGCTLYYLLAAQPPYQGNSIMAVLLKHRDAPIPSLRGTRPELPAALDTLLTGMMAKQPGDRISSMTEVVKTLEGIKADGQRGPALSATVVSADVRSSADWTVILVEPSRTQAGIVRRYLQELGIEKVHHAGSGRQALELARQHRAQVLISSLHLGDMTGLQLAVALRADPACSAMGFVLTTSGSDDEDLSALRTLPGAALMPKPFDVKKLATALTEATGCAIGART